MKIEQVRNYLQINQKITLLLFISAAAMALLILRVLATQNLGFSFLTWNLFLAWIPLVFSKWLLENERYRPSPLWLLTGYLMIWLLFFPNAPYIVTDLKHIRGLSDDTIWYDTLMIFIFSIAGFLPGLYSIRIIHRIVSMRWNEKLAWIGVTGSMILSGFGIFLGRYGRWNSWDVVAHPYALMRGIFQSLQNPLAIKHTLVFSFVLMLLYFAFHYLAELKQHESSHKYS